MTRPVISLRKRRMRGHLLVLRTSPYYVGAFNIVANQTLYRMENVPNGDKILLYFCQLHRNVHHQQAHPVRVHLLGVQS